MNPGPQDNRAAGVDELLALLAGLCPPLEPERIPLADSTGRVLRETVAAPEDQPAFDRSSVDGFAVRLDDSADRFQVVDEIRAGDWKPRELGRGEAVRIATGGALPGAGLRVVMLEDVRAEGGDLVVLQQAGDRNIRFKGEDASAGQVLVEGGTLLGPGAVALLAGAGCAQPLVSRLPRVLHIATGSELVEPGSPPGQGGIRDTNSSLVRSFLALRGIQPRQQRAAEDREAVAAAVGAALQGDPPDILLISGGASVGRHDFSLQVLVECGFTIHTRRTTLRPGKPLILARNGRTIAFGLPGNPLAHFVCLNLFLRASLDAFAGTALQARAGFESGRLAVDLPSDRSSRETFWPARWSLDDGGVAVIPLRWASSGDLTSLARANALVRVPPGTAALPQGARIQFIPTGCLP